MSELNECSTSKKDAPKFEVLAKPSDVIKTFNKTISVAGSYYELTLITMKRSFLLVMEDAQEGRNIAAMSSETLIQSFMRENSSLKGLSLAVGGNATCLIASEHSLASLSLASRLSKTLNNNGPVYVANNIQQSELSSLYEKVFSFVTNCREPCVK